MLACTIPGIASDPAAGYTLTVETDRIDALYQVGETVTFRALLRRGQEPVDIGEVDWMLSKDGWRPPVSSGSATLPGGQGTITGQLAEPGFLQCEVTFRHDGQTVTSLAAAGIDPLQIKPSLPAPADFDAFWARQKRELNALPLHSRFTAVAVPPDHPGVEAFDLQADCLGAPVSGYYARPVGACPGSCAARLVVPGAGVRSADLDSVVNSAQKGLISLDINAHGIANGQPPEFYAALDAGDLNDYRTRGRSSREAYYFLGAHLRTLRALQFLKSQPEWDGRTLILTGGSQGGALAIAGAALDPQVTFLVAINPALCDHTGMLANRIAGWPKLVPVDASGQPDPSVLEVSRYFDSVNFAPRVLARGCYLQEGFLDVICPPTGVFAAYNLLPEKKQMVNLPVNGHGIDGAVLWPAVAVAEAAHLAEQKR